MKSGGNVCLVTGASSGLGKALAELLCEKDYIIYVVARREKLLKELETECKKVGKKGIIKIISGDLTDRIFRMKLIEEIVEKEGCIDYLFNNAGFGKAEKFEEMKSGDLEMMFKINVFAYLHLAQLVIPQMKKQGFGRIINVGSVVAFTPLPYFTNYNATKSAIYMFNRSLRYELKDFNVKSTVVLPARMKTGFADNAYDCYAKHGRTECVEKFNKIAGSPYQVAKVILKNMKKGKEVITPTFKAKIWYLMRYFGFVVDLIMKNVLGPKELRTIIKAEHSEKVEKKI
jgi:short-subunit dehydrogenase